MDNHSVPTLKVSRRARIRRRIEWYLTTDFDPHEPVARPTVHAILIILTIIYVWGGLK